MFPTGMRIVNASYREEAGHGQMLRNLLTPDLEAELATMSIAGADMLGLTRTWIAAADELGDLENQRLKVLTEGRNGDMSRARAT